ncbi:MAG TPA: cation:proton antiporter [Bacteroidales bacterium]|nr:cation:proton antiporter [Bacteroidales bacterium]
MLILIQSLNLPLKDPVLIFSIILFIILFAPILLNKLKIPHLIGLIIAGALIGPHGFNLLMRDSSITLFGTVGLLYIMFLAGLEMDLGTFRKNSGRSVVFGMLTFLIPMILGIGAGYYLLNFSMMTSVLLASMFASHTLLAYPIISKLGVQNSRSVVIAVGGTLITDTLALLVLAVIANMATGEISTDFWLRLSISITIFTLIVVFIFPLLSRWFFKKYDDNILHYIFSLAMVFLGAALAQAAGIEHIIGAFLAGLALNKLIPRTSPLMNRIEFVGNALFIPIFLIGVGMLVDYRAFIRDSETIIVALVMTSVAIFGKFLAAFFTQKIFSLKIYERNIIFGLSNAQAAATLAAVLVGYNIILGYDQSGAPIRLLNDAVLNGSIVMILITCTIASFAAQRGAQRLALSEMADEQDADTTSERILIALSNKETLNELVNFSMLIKSKNNKHDVIGLHVLNNDPTRELSEKKADKLLEEAADIASASDVFMRKVLRYDLNLVNGITSAANETKSTDLVLGVQSRKGISDNFLGNLTEGILNKSDLTVWINKAVQPIQTIKRYIIVVPDRAEKEIGFPLWVVKVWNISRNTGARIDFFASNHTIEWLQVVQKNHPVEASFTPFADWDDFLILSREIRENDALMVILSRKGFVSYNEQMAKIPGYLNKYFTSNNFILVYPSQSAENWQSVKLSEASVFEPLSENLERFEEFTKYIGKLFKRK